MGDLVSIEYVQAKWNMMVDGDGMDFAMNGAEVRA